LENFSSSKIIKLAEIKLAKRKVAIGGIIAGKDNQNVKPPKNGASGY
jgi:hypothetical protein